MNVTTTASPRSRPPEAHTSYVTSSGPSDVKVTIRVASDKHRVKYGAYQGMGYIIRWGDDEELGLTIGWVVSLQLAFVFGQWPEKTCRRIECQCAHTILVSGIELCVPV